MQSQAVTKRVLLASLVGSAIEWFDFFLYGTATGIVFNRLFFPAADPKVSLMLAYASFALPFLIRPIGGLVFAHIGDRIGRKKTLIVTLLLMGTGTTLIGLLPSYDSIGIAAPILLVALRLLQGLGLGGEWGGAVLLAFEFAPAHRKGLYASVPQAGVPFGMLLSALCLGGAALLPEGAFLQWGWRIPFIASAILVVLGLWIRNGIDETPEFERVRQSGQLVRYPALELVRRSWPQVLMAIVLKFGETASFYTFAVFLVSYATAQLGYSRTLTLAAVAAGAGVAAVVIPVCGALADRFGRRIVFCVGSLGMIAFSAPYFLLLDRHSPVALFAATIIAIGIVWPPITATLSSLLADAFPAGLRYTGITFGYQIGAALVGGTAPLIATLLISANHGRWYWVAAYVALLSAASLGALLAIRPAIAGNGTMRQPTPLADPI